jgi:hypothetical protein
LVHRPTTADRSASGLLPRGARNRTTGLTGSAITEKTVRGRPRMLSRIARLDPAGLPWQILRRIPDWFFSR